MAQFQSIVITLKGRALIAKMLAGAEKVDFKRILTSSAEYTPEQLPDLAALKTVNQATLISQITRINGTTIKIEGGLNNTELTQSYNCNTVGVTAVDPEVGEILFGVTIVDRSIPENTPDFIPSFNGITSTGLLFDLVLTVDNADSITLQVDPAAIVTVKMFLEHTESETAHENRFAEMQKQIDFIMEFIRNERTGILVGADGKEREAVIQLPDGEVHPMLLQLENGHIKQLVVKN